MHKAMRQLHRWISILFTLAVIFNGAAIFMHKYANWMGFLAVIPLFAMLLTGLYLFAIPYLPRRR